MAETIINKGLIDPYWKRNKRHKNYLKAVDVAHHIQFHFNGYFQTPWLMTATAARPELVNPYFQRLIDARRPGESDYIMKYRRSAYLPITKVPCNKVVSSLKKIVKSDDWKIDYSKSENPTFLPDNKTLELYCETNFPNDDSIENFAYKNIVRWMLTDPNAIIVVMPLNWDVEDNELYKPYPHIIQTKDVYHISNDMAIFLSPYETTYKDEEGNSRDGKILTVVTKDSFYDCVQISTEDYRIDQHPHNIGELPAWTLGGESKTPDINQPFFESFINGMLPSLDAAAGDYSDLQAEKVQHLYSTMWYIQSQECKACNGSGFSSTLSQGKQVICQDCEGRGSMKFSPYKSFEVNKSNLDPSGANLPIPPAGYITKPTDMVGLMRNEIDLEIKASLAAINMEFLAETPMNESGKAKEVDKDELNNFVYAIAYHLVEEIVNPIYWFTNEIRYMKAVPDPKMRAKMLPHIDVPQSFDFLTQRDAVDNMIKIVGSKVSANIKDLAEMKYIHSEFQDIPEIREKMNLIHNHDPFPNYESTDLQTLITGGIIKKVDAVLSTYIVSFVDELIKTNPKFLELKFGEQKETLVQMAQDKMQEIEDAAQDSIIKLANKPPLLDAEGNEVDLQGNVINTKEQLDAKNLGSKKPAKRNNNSLKYA